MLDVNLPYYWSHGRLVFTSWFLPSGLLMRHLALRHSTNTSLRSFVTANVTMGVASWIFVVGFPVAIALEQLVHVLILDRIPTGRADPISWISVLVFSALIASVAEVSVLRVFFKRRLGRRAVGLLLVIDLCCVAGAAYASVKYVLAHPTYEWRNIFFMANHGQRLLPLICGIRSLEDLCSRAEFSIQGVENPVPVNTFMLRHGPKDAIERPDTKRSMRRNSYTLRRRFLRLQDDVAAGLIDFDVAPTATERGNKLFAAQITRNLHPSASISSRTK